MTAASAPMLVFLVTEDFSPIFSVPAESPIFVPVVYAVLFPSATPTRAFTSGFARAMTAKRILATTTFAMYMCL